MRKEQPDETKQSDKVLSRLTLKADGSRAFYRSGLENDHFHPKHFIINHNPEYIGRCHRACGAMCSVRAFLGFGDRV